ncbi:hypothetical protein T4B_10113 [Trichinella pseudospiralis]|uniref:Uncharacterized protein n=1 Tax=Trichinella pseudospiralis TaxID=6337 RepID=A0A0V1G9E3_TRIPS|nr:hypothetical protein T4A_7072 [Trichinella pseudospiralis]KRY94849.1 hypothetical protein T4B_2082 [Trichinella pseudospiralis]KRY95894.1 hypothetical protein T4C_13875 [Trichinella pseudospiralis]KRY96043.1 hypothetical protein T4B_6543 [Trichinella pseudospiralis]KRY97646.1 hypothetical protein T4B_10113 [Trichinella pseudospiralis]
MIISINKFGSIALSVIEVCIPHCISTENQTTI